MGVLEGIAFGFCVLLILAAIKVTADVIRYHRQIREENR